MTQQRLPGTSLVFPAREIIRFSSLRSSIVSFDVTLIAASDKFRWQNRLPGFVSRAILRLYQSVPVRLRVQ